MENPNDPKDEELDFEEQEEQAPELEGVCHNCFKEVKAGVTFCGPECAKEYEEDISSEDLDEDADGDEFDEEFDEDEDQDATPTRAGG